MCAHWEEWDWPIICSRLYWFALKLDKENRIFKNVISYNLNRERNFTLKTISNWDIALIFALAWVWGWPHLNPSEMLRSIKFWNKNWAKFVGNQASFPKTPSETQLYIRYWTKFKKSHEVCRKNVFWFRNGIDYWLLIDETCSSNELSNARWKRLFFDRNFMVLQNIVFKTKFSLISFSYVYEST